MKPIKIEGYEVYCINEEGVVQNSRTGRVLKADLNSSGYKRVTLSVDGKLKRITVHKLVALTFLEPVEGALIVNHKDGNKHNNHYSNLEWTTYHENAKHAFATGLRKGYRGNLPNAIIHEICQRLVYGETLDEISLKTGAHRTTISNIKTRRFNTNISKHYSF